MMHTALWYFFLKGQLINNLKLFSLIMIKFIHFFFLILLSGSSDGQIMRVVPRWWKRRYIPKVVLPKSKLTCSQHTASRKERERERIIHAQMLKLKTRLFQQSMDTILKCVWINTKGEIGRKMSNFNFHAFGMSETLACVRLSSKCCRCVVFGMFSLLQKRA